MVGTPRRLKHSFGHELLRVGLAALLLLAADAALARGPWRASEQNTRGWQLMSPEERIDHQTKMRGFRDYEECHAYQLDHHRRMAERASTQGLALKQEPRDACAHLRPAEAGR